MWIGSGPIDQRIDIRLLTLGVSSLATAWLSANALVTIRDLRFSGTCRISDAAEELSEAAAAFDQPPIFACRAGRAASTAPTSNLTRPIGTAWQGRTARQAGGQQVSAVLDMLAPVPDAAILPGHAQQSSPTFAADMSLGFGPWGC